MPTSQQFPPIDSYDLVALIPNGTTTSQQLDLAGNCLCGLFMPAAFTGASIKITAAATSGGTTATVQKDEVGGGDYTITATAGKYIPVSNLNLLAGTRFINLISASSEGADRSITLAVRPL